MLTHLPFKQWCQVCVACRKSNAAHAKTNEEQRTIPLLTADYCFLQGTGDEEPLTTVVARVRTSRLNFALALSRKGGNKHEIRRMARVIREAGLFKGEKHTRIRTSEGSICNVTFQCADVDMPVLSTRKLCESGHEVLYKHNGGLIIDTKTGQTTKFVMRAGVYYLKLRVLKPAGHERAAGFGRQA